MRLTQSLSKLRLVTTRKKIYNAIIFYHHAALQNVFKAIVMWRIISLKIFFYNIVIYADARIIYWATFDMVESRTIKLWYEL